MHYLDKFKYCPVCGSSRFEEHDFKSKHCADCGFTYYFNSAAAVVAIIVNEKGNCSLAEEEKSQPETHLTLSEDLPIAAMVRKMP